MSVSELLPVGTDVVFTKTIEQGPTGDTPGFLFARKGDRGVITGHSCFMDYSVKWEHWPASSFHCGRDEIEPANCSPADTRTAGESDR